MKLIKRLMLVTAALLTIAPTATKAQYTPTPENLKARDRKSVV